MEKWNLVVSQTYGPNKVEIYVRLIGRQRQYQLGLSTAADERTYRAETKLAYLYDVAMSEERMRANRDDDAETAIRHACYAAEDAETESNGGHPS